MSDLEEAKNPSGKNISRLIQIRITASSLAKIPLMCQTNSGKHGWKEASFRKLHHECRERRQDRQHPVHH